MSYSCLPETLRFDIIGRSMVHIWTGKQLGQKTATIHMDMVTSIVFSLAIKRLQEAASKQKIPADYALIGDDILRNSLWLVM